MKKTISLLLCAVLLLSLAGCGGSAASSAAAPASNAAPAAANASGEKTLTFGCQMYSDGMIAPWLQTNCAWNCMRYGISEALFQFDDNSRAVACGVH